MKTYHVRFLSLATFFMLLCSMSILSRTVVACPMYYCGPTTFTAGPGGSQTQTWTVIDDIGGATSTSFIIIGGAGMFSLSQMPVVFPSSDADGDSATFTITFNPSENSTGTFKATLECRDCDDKYELVGTVASSGLTNSLPSNVSFTITPNPATDHVNILSNGVRTAEIGIYDVHGKKIGSSKTTDWIWDASGIPTGSYIVRIVGESHHEEQFAILRRIIVAR